MGRSSKSLVALAAIALLSAMGAAYALASPGGTAVTVCVKHGGGTLYKARRCAKHDTELSWSKQGPDGRVGPAGATGPRGLQGPGGVQGPAGQPATKLFGYIHEGINADTGTANVVYGSGVTAVDDPAGNTPYTVTFNQSVANCVVQAEAGTGNPDGGSNSVLPTAIPSVHMDTGSNDNSVQVKFENPAGATQDTSFLVSAFC